MTIYNVTLKWAIVHSGFTQRQLARRTGIEETRLSRIVRLQITPYPHERAALAAALGRSERDLFPGTTRSARTRRTA